MGRHRSTSPTSYRQRQQSGINSREGRLRSISPNNAGKRSSRHKGGDLRDTLNTKKRRYSGSRRVILTENSVYDRTGGRRPFNKGGKESRSRSSSSESGLSSLEETDKQSINWGETNLSRIKEIEALLKRNEQKLTLKAKGNQKVFVSHTVRENQRKAEALSKTMKSRDSNNGSKRKPENERRTPRPTAINRRHHHGEDAHSDKHDRTKTSKNRKSEDASSKLKNK